ncbi:MAG TPA: polyprenol monophosphomannose synthase [Candidatus Nanoarchaeia archaeon]
MKVTIVLPTYKERENVVRLIPELFEQFKNARRHHFEILVVDDESPDRTAEAVKELAKKLPGIHLLTGKKQGLGAAYIRGFKYAINKLKADVLVEMDADFSHLPQDVPRLIEQIEKGADFVIGSRYIRGGKVPEDWNFFRRANSRWGNRFARYLAGIDDVRDCTSGFRAIKREVLDKINLDKLKVRGYSFQMNLLYKAFVNGAKIKEIPIDFQERTWGHTKLGPSDILEFMWNSVKLRMEKGFTDSIRKKPFN